MRHIPSVTDRSARSGQPAPYADLLKVSAYDRVASLLVALLVLLGLCVAVLFIIFLTTRVFIAAPLPEVFLVEEEAGTQNPVGTGQDIEEPGVQDLQDLAQPDINETLSAVTDAVSSVAAGLDSLEAILSSAGSGAGDRRQRGHGGDVLGRWQRWEIRFLSTTLETYAQQLEFFGIELAALGGGRPGVDYVYFDKGALKPRSDARGQDDRLYFIWQGGEFQQQDRALLNRAGIATSGRVICQFYSKQLENQLTQLEREKLGDRPLKDVQRTVFGVRPAGRGYEFFVSEIQWRR